MLRLWRDIHAEKLPVSAGALISVVTHAVLIAGAVEATQRPLGLNDASDELANRAYYVPPPHRVPRQSAAPEQLQYIALAPQGAGIGFGPATFTDFKPVQDARSTTTRGDAGRDAVMLDARREIASDDSIFSDVDVDSVARRDPDSAAPTYPPELLKESVQGFVTARYVVDTSGLADVATFTVEFATHPLFATAVRDALPGMHFEPARLHGAKVRQLVEQRFTFRITPPAVAETPRKP